METSKIIKQVEMFLVEMEASQAVPNTLILSYNYFELLKKSYPYLIKDNKFLTSKSPLKIILTKEDVISVGLCYDYSEETLNEVTPSQ